MLRNPTVIFRITNACNLNCTYCYDKGNHVNRKMENEKILENIDQIIWYLNKIFKYKDKPKNIIFHGGEPLLISPKTYERVINRINESFSDIKYTIQSNGTLLNQDYINLLKKYNISLGISLDGYDEATNCQRVYRNNINSFNIVMKKIELLKNNNIDFGVIFTLTKSIIGYEKELYDFISKNGIKCNVRPAFGNDENIIMSEDEYYEFFTTFFDIWMNYTSETSLKQITEIYEEFRKAIEPSYIARSCVNSNTCFKDFMSLDIDGNVYGCNRTYNNKEFYWGNLNINTLEEIENKIIKKIEIRKRSIENSLCKECKIFNDCNGGCPSNAYMKHGTIKEPDSYFCKSRVKIRDYVIKRIKEEKENKNN